MTHQAMTIGGFITIDQTPPATRAIFAKHRLKRREAMNACTCNMGDQKPKGGLFRQIQPHELIPAILILKGLDARLNILESQRAAATQAAAKPPVKAPAPAINEPRSESSTPESRQVRASEQASSRGEMGLERTVGNLRQKSTQHPISTPDAAARDRAAARVQAARDATARKREAEYAQARAWRTRDMARVGEMQKFINANARWR